MQQETADTLTRLPTTIPAKKRTLFEAGFFLLVWPTFNFLFITSVMLQVGRLETVYHLIRRAVGARGQTIATE